MTFMQVHNKHSPHLVQMMPITRVPVRFVVVIKSVVIPSLLVINSTGRFLTTGSTADGHMHHSKLGHGMFPDCDCIIAETHAAIL